VVIALCRICSNPFAIDVDGDPAFTIAPDDAGDRCPQCRQLASRRIASAELGRARAAIAHELLLRVKD
jgi:hypothetical protein